MNDNNAINIWEQDTPIADSFNCESEALKKACERFSELAVRTNYKLTYDANGKITNCKWNKIQ